MAPGDKVPSESVLMARYAVSQGTARKAVAELRPMGLIDTHHGKGSFVKSRPPVLRKSSDRFRRSHRRAGKAAYLAESEQAGRAPAVAVLFIGPVEAPGDISDRLGLAPGSQVLARRRLYLSDRTPTEVAVSYLPWDLAKDIPELFAGRRASAGTRCAPTTCFRRARSEGPAGASGLRAGRARGCPGRSPEAPRLSPATPAPVRSACAGPRWCPRRSPGSWSRATSGPPGTRS
ncbi:GntR family transcriptional regulator [Streptomyces sp. ITFR-6]|uniref:GntR family transcriptional regulator n=1 Tax=Streptomyces sp. ITFR-6 TaxID=3075197 RepID=UPI0037D9C8F2